MKANKNEIQLWTPKGKEQKRNRQDTGVCVCVVKRIENESEKSESESEKKESFTLGDWNEIEEQKDGEKAPHFCLDSFSL